MSELAFRRLVEGAEPNGARCTSLVELGADRVCVVLRLGCLQRFSVALDGDAVRMLLLSLRERTACAVPVRHDEHGDRLLAASPHDRSGQPPWTRRPISDPAYRGPMELTLSLPDGQIRVVLAGEHLVRLVATLTDAGRLVAD